MTEDEIISYWEKQVGRLDLAKILREIKLDREFPHIYCYDYLEIPPQPKKCTAIVKYERTS